MKRITLFRLTTYLQTRNAALLRAMPKPGVNLMDDLRELRAADVEEEAGHR